MKTFRSGKHHFSGSKPFLQKNGYSTEVDASGTTQDDRSLSFGTMHIECSRDELCSLSLVSRRIGLQVTILRVFER